MQKSIDIKLRQAPILYQFIKSLFLLDGRIDVRFDLGEELFIEERCTCTDNDCATVYLRRDKEWKKEILGSLMINTTKGFVTLHFGDDGYLELEALCYKEYPYKYEIQRVLSGDFSSPKASEIKLLEEYFIDLNVQDMPQVFIEI